MKLFHWFEQLSLRIKLAIGYGTLIGLMLIAGATALLGHERTLATMEAFLDGDHRIAELSLESSAAMGKARRYEKEFLLKVRVFSYEEARSRYATLVTSQLTQVRENMATIRSLSGKAEITSETRAIEDVTRLYEAGFLRAVELHGRLGKMDAGLEGQIRTRAHAIDAVLAQDGPERLRSDLLTLRRHEKDFIQRGATPYAKAFESSADRFMQDVVQSTLPLERKNVLRRLIEQYRELFREYVATDTQIDAVTQDYLAAVHQIEPQLERLHAHADATVAATRATMHNLSQTTAMAMIIVGLAAILLGLLVASFIVRNTNRSVAACVNFANRLASGDWSVRMPSSGGRNEFALLTMSLNRMTDAMHEAHDLDVLRTTELSRLNRTLHMLSRCNEALVRADSELKLLETICQQIVDIGGYRLAWVGFACHDEAKSVRPAAYAGLDGDYVAGLNLTWGDDQHRRGVGGRAIYEGKLVVTHDIATDPVFEPWRQQAAKRGFVSCIALPLKSKGEVLGTLSIYSTEANVFDAGEVDLLQELAGDLAFGIVSLREAERRKEAERVLDYQANFDQLTGLANRNLFCDRLRQAMLHAARANRQLAVLVLSLDRFKAIKDSLGHNASDILLQQVGKSLSATLREGDTVARVAGNEFALCISDLVVVDEVVALALKLLAIVLEPMTLQGQNIYTSASIGISLYPKDGNEVDSLLQNADAAMSSARSSGGNLFHFYAAEMNERVSAQFAMEAELRRALTQDELRVYYQPRVNLASGEMSGAEALVRWQHPERGMIAPSDFIPLAEDTGLILPLGAWVIKSVCRQQRAWLDAGLAATPVAVNLSALQFRQENLTQLIQHELKINQLMPAYLEMEITESALMDNQDQAVATLQELKLAGIKLSLDDFGTGHSSLSRLRHLPIDHLKIDQSFVRNLTTDPKDAAVCLSIIGLAHNLHMTVIAEGVETEGQATYLRQHRCDEMQGYYFSRPLPSAEFEQLLVQSKALELPTQTPDEHRTLLLVDDESKILSTLKRVLRQDGYTIYSAASAQEGLALLSTHKIQVILSDQRMPEMNGTEFLSRVRDLYPHTIRLVLSGYADLDSITDAINHGAIYKFLTKPWDNEALRADLRAAFRHYESNRRI